MYASSPPFPLSSISTGDVSVCIRTWVYRELGEQTCDALQKKDHLIPKVGGVERVDRSLCDTHGVGRTQEQERKERREGGHGVFPEEDLHGKLVVQSVPIAEHGKYGLLVAEGIGRGEQHLVPETRLQK